MSSLAVGTPDPRFSVSAATYILDKNLKPAGIHLAGELDIGGSGLAVAISMRRTRLPSDSSRTV